MQDSDFLNHNIDRLMRDKAEWFGARIRQRAPGSAKSEFTEAEGMIFGTLRGRELTVSEIARLRGVSRQAIHRTVSGLIQRGYLKLKHASGSQRDKVVVVTPAGQRVRDRVGDILREVEEEIASKIGRKRLELLREILMSDWSAEKTDEKREE